MNGSAAGGASLVCANLSCGKTLGGQVPFCPYCGHQQTRKDDWSGISSVKPMEVVLQKVEAPQATVESPEVESPEVEASKVEASKVEIARPDPTPSSPSKWKWAVILLLVLVAAGWLFRTPPEPVPAAPVAKEMSPERPPSAQRPKQPAPPPVASPPVVALPARTAALPPASISPSPVRVASLTIPDVRPGDRWLLQTQDHNNPQWSNATERTVIEVGDSTMSVTSRNLKSNYTRTLTFTREWNLLAEREPSGKSATYSPAMHYLDFPLEVGKAWHKEIHKQKSEGGSERVYTLTARIHDWERVEVPAGAFDAVKVVLEIEIREDGVLLSQSTDTSWYSPQAKRSVKTEESSRDMKTGQEGHRTIVLSDYTVSR